MKLTFTAMLASLLTVSIVVAEPIKVESTPLPISNKAVFKNRFDNLYWRGGLVMKSDYKKFGGLSGIELSSDGKRLLAISDRGHWFKATIGYKNGALNNISNAEMSPLLNANGQRFKSWEIDSEGLTKRSGSLSDVIVSTERNQALMRYKLGNNLTANAMKWGTIIDAKKITRNKGLESVTILPKSHKYRGWLLAIAEKKLDKNGNHTAWLVNGKINHTFNLKRYADFDITDVSYLPNGDIVVLERSIALFSGATMRIRQICGRDIKPNALVDGYKLIESGWSLSVDNMEGIAVHKASNGETILTVISDDNFHFLQRNLLLQFALVNNRSVCK